MGLSEWHLVILLAIVVLIFAAGRNTGVLDEIMKRFKE